LGKKFYAEASFKRYPCCLQNYPGIECALALIHKKDIPAEEIEEVTVRMPRRFLDSYLGQPFSIGDFPHANAVFSYQYGVATALLRKGVKPEHFSEASIRDPQVNALIAKTRLTELPEKDTYAAEVKVRMSDGREFSESTDAPKDDPIRAPMSKEEIIGKFRANVDFSQTVTKSNAKELLNRLENLEDIHDVKTLVRLLVA
jgi:2-methylcitrate dehydratase PrpD